jgi:beta-lactamase superfamily II metal-dependent hydrolase
MTITWQNVKYKIVDCGGGGHCLFSSLAHVLVLAGQLGSEETYATLRQDAAETLRYWVDNEVPDWFDDQFYEVPDNGRVDDLLDGDWGDATTLLATLLRHHPNVRVTVIWREDAALKSWTVDAEAAGHDVDTDVLLWWNGGTHYQALEPTDDDDSDDEDEEEEEEEEETNTSILKIPTKLSTGSTLSTGITTVKPVGPLEIHLLDIGQGEATLIRFAGTAILIDGGRATRGGGTLLRYLAKLKIATIHHMICTHYDADHVEGLTAVLLSGIAVERVWTPGNLFVGNDEGNGLVEGLDNKYRDFGQAIIDHATKLSQRMKRGDSIELGPLHITCLLSGAGSGFDSNDHSIALRIKYYRFTYYTAGDLESGMEKTIVGDIVVGKGHLCAMKCGHHGSSGSTPTKLLKKCSPQVALISCGRHSYCHPDDDLIGRLCSASSIQQFYLTNCFYNRAGVNPNYDTRLKDEIDEWEESKKKRTRESRRDKKLDSYKPQKQTRNVRGTVAGDDKHLGTIIIRVDGAEALKTQHSFEVGYWDAGGTKWVWRKHICGSKVEDGVRSDDRTSLVNIQGLDTHLKDAWLKDVTSLRKVVPFSLLTKPSTTEKKEKEPLDDDERRYALEEEEANWSDSSGSEFEEESQRKKRQKKEVKKKEEEEKKKDDSDEDEEL